VDRKELERTVLENFIYYLHDHPVGYKGMATGSENQEEVDEKYRQYLSDIPLETCYVDAYAMMMAGAEVLALGLVEVMVENDISYEEIFEQYEEVGIDGQSKGEDRNVNKDT